MDPRAVAAYKHAEARVAAMPKAEQAIARQALAIIWSALTPDEQRAVRTP